jgi:Transglycosylase SLT domain
VTGSVGAYVASVDRLLTRGHRLFPASGGNIKLDGGPGSPPSPPGTSELGKGAAGAGDDYDRSRQATADTDDDTTGAAADGSQVGQDGRSRTGQVRDTARTQADAIMPSTNSAGGVRLMASTMDQRLSDMQREIDSTKAQNKLLVARLRQVAAAYRSGSPMGMGGFGGMPGLGGGSGVGFPGGGISGLTGLGGLPGMMMQGGSRRPGAEAGNIGTGAEPGRNPAGAAGIAEAAIPVSEVSFEGKGVWPGGESAIRRYLGEALDRMGITDPAARARWTAGMMTIADHESSYRADAINLSDSNAHGPRQVDGGPLNSSRGPWQVIPSTFAAYHQPGTSNHIWDPVANACASMNYQMHHYGVTIDAGNQRAKVGQANPGVYRGY